MKDDNSALLLEIMDMLKTVAEGQQKLLKEVHELKEEQKKLYEEVRLNNFVLNNITVRGELLN